MRERISQHRANPACASCHATMDPLGFAMENFNAIGALITARYMHETGSTAEDMAAICVAST